MNSKQNVHLKISGEVTGKHWKCQTQVCYKFNPNKEQWIKNKSLNPADGRHTFHRQGTYYMIFVAPNDKSITKFIMQNTDLNFL